MKGSGTWRDHGLWQVLPSLRHFTVQVETEGEGGTRLAHLGTGGLRVQEVNAPDAASVIWREHGRWTLGPLAGIPFHNTTAWRRSPAGIELSHLRRGMERPTFLVRLVPDACGRWTGVEPHRCGTDRYHAILEQTEDGIRLTWEVESPTDPYHLVLAAHRLPPP